MAKKVPMVAPKPFMIAGGVDKLAEVLQQLGNTRSYTLIRSHGNTWRVHFAGDYVLSTVKYVYGKPVIIKDEK
jgi:hypothetical protein